LNVRAETVGEKPIFRSAFKSRRRIITASAFCERSGTNDAKVPHYFSSPDGEPPAFAGLGENWRNPESGESILSPTIIVCSANAWMTRYLDRAPVLIERQDFDAWLSGDDPAALLREVREDVLREWVASHRVNRSGAGDEDPAALLRIADQKKVAIVELSFHVERDLSAKQNTQRQDSCAQ